ncbi:MAG: CYTH domain-containing protein [Pseudomonadota bacterium]
MLDTSNIPVEAEATLLIYSKHPRAVAREVADLAAVAAFRPDGGIRGVLNDTYLDTPGSDLRQRHWILRLRRISSTWWITLKGPSRETPHGVMERGELEMPWSLDAFVHLMNTFDIRFTGRQAAHIASTDPLEIMRELGMAVVQHRVTERLVKNVFLTDKPVVVAEIAVDRVRYDLAGGEILHHEIEIESKHADYGSAVGEIAGDLLERFAPILRVWKIGKLATGLMIDTLIRKNALDGLINEDGSLQPEAYDRLANFRREVSF